MTSFSRRQFLVAGAASAVTATYLSGGLSELQASPLGLPVGLQLYTVKEDLAKDFNGTLQQVAAAGYKEVEAAGFYDRKAADFKHSIEAVGLRLPGAHYSLQSLLEGLDEKIAFAHDLGLQYLICSFPFVADPSRLQRQKDLFTAVNGLTPDDWKWNADQFNRIGALTRKAGIQFGYHNHFMEFREYNGTVLYDSLLSWTDPQLVKMELDCGWVASTGKDPAAYIAKYPDRIELLHIKDMKPAPSLKGEDAHSTELGRGTIDWKKVFDAAKHASIKHYFVEQEQPFTDMPALEAIKVNYDYLSKL